MGEQVRIGARRLVVAGVLGTVLVSTLGEGVATGAVPTTLPRAVFTGRPTTTIKGRKPAPTTRPARNVPPVRLAESKVATARSGGDQRALADALKDLGYQQLLVKDFAACAKTLGEAEAVYRKLKDDLNLSASLQMHGWALISANRGAEALPVLDEAVVLRRKLISSAGGQAALVEVMQLLSQAQRAAGRGTEAIKTLEEVLAMAAGGAKGIDTATTSLLIGSIYMDQKNPTAAVKYFERAVVETEDKPSLQVDALQAQAWALTEAKRSSEAVPALQKAIRLAGPSIEKTKQGVDLYSLLANAAREAKQSNVEVEARQKVVALARAGVAGSSLLEALDNLGLTLILSNRYADAVAPLRELAALARKTPGSNARLGSALHNLGWALSALKQYDEAITSLQEAVTIREQLRDPDLVQTLRFLGYAMWSTKDNRATDVFKDALQLLESSKASPLEIAQGTLDVSSSLLYEGRYPDALQPANTALDMFTRNNGTDEQIAAANYNVGWALFSSRKPNEAIPYLTKARDIRIRLALAGASDASDMLDAAIAQTKA